ncbi:hypothetical protein CsSME_00024855 [Camellia sinensis var. sinensis]
MSDGHEYFGEIEENINSVIFAIPTLTLPSFSPPKQLAEKELQKINAFKAPREKLLCILNCCRVINNLLLNASVSENRVPGADDFLPVLIYITIKASPHW